MQRSRKRNQVRKKTLKRNKPTQTDKAGLFGALTQIFQRKL